MNFDSLYFYVSELPPDYEKIIWNMISYQNFSIDRAELPININGL